MAAPDEDLAPDEGLCSRCQRLKPDIESEEYIEWEASEDGRPICPGCLTGFEQEEIDRDAMEWAEKVSVCARCGRNADEASAEEFEDWIAVKDEAGETIVVCARCRTSPEVLEDLETIRRVLGDAE